MPDEPKKIVYLFGAGATHAEITNTLDIETDSNQQDKYGLLIDHISERVLSKVKKKTDLSNNINYLLPDGRKGNIELLISLIEMNKLEKFEEITNELKQLVKKDINKIIKKASKSGNFILYKSLFEFRRNVE